MTRVFLDACVYFAGFYSEGGASELIMELASRKKLAVYASRLVLREADRNLRIKASVKNAKAFRQFLNQTKIQIISPPSDEEISYYESYIHPKDAPILAAAVKSEAAFLIALDHRHFFTPQVLSKVLKPKIMTPGDFVREICLKGKW